MRARLKSKRFFIQILMLTISFLLILCIFFVAILHTNANKSIMNAILQSETERNTDLLRQSDIYWQQLTALGGSYISISIPYKDLNGTDHFWTRKMFDSMMSSHMNSNHYISNIDVVIEGNSLSPSQISHERQLDNLFFFEIFTSEKAVWPYSFDLQPKPELQSNQITFTVDGYYLSRQLFTYSARERLDYLITPDGTILLTNQQASFFQKIDEVLPGISLSDSAPSRKTISTYKDYYYVISEPDKYDFRILSLVPQAFYSQQYTAITSYTILMSVCLLLVALVISVFLTVYFYRPINKTVELLLTYIPDDIHEYENEIAFIHQNITKYVAKENKAESIMSETLPRIQNAQTAVLQHQINSHFLFNTLENIKAISISKLGIDNAIENSIFLLNNIIKEGIFQKNIFVSLSHELYLARCYLELMHMRFSDVDVYWDWDESLSQCQVFKFSLQPVLENCFTHAFRKKIDQKKRITISVNREGEDFCIRVVDNGIGIHEGDVVLDEQPIRDSKAPTSFHVGIRNIHKRITDIFGQGYGIRISAANPGTLVEIRYPVVMSPPIEHEP